MTDAVGTATEGLTLDELSERSGVPRRTVRFYQSRGLLPAPQRKGREARYQPSTIERLHLIGGMQDAGLRLSAIAQLLRQAGDEHTSLPEWLGLGATLAHPWSEDRPILLTEEELAARIGQRPPGTVAALEGAGLVERRSDTVPVMFLLPSPALLDIALALHDAGVPADVIKSARALMQRRLSRLADELASHVTENLSMERLAAAGPEDVAALIERLRPIARRAVDVVFAHEMERAVQRIVRRGGRPSSSGRRRR